MEALLSLRRPTEAVVSPDGRQVAGSVLDAACTNRQGEELYRGIAGTGLAEVELVTYPREGHGITERAHQLDFWERARAFFDRHLRGDLTQVAENT